MEQKLFWCSSLYALAMRKLICVTGSTIKLHFCVVTAACSLTNIMLQFVILEILGITWGNYTASVLNVKARNLLYHKLGSIMTGLTGHSVLN